MTVALPSVSTAGIRRTTALRRAIRVTPIANATVSTIGRPSGTAATASATATRSSSTGSPPRSSPSAITASAETSVASAMIRDSRPIRSLRGVAVSGSSLRSPAIAPSSVPAPVAYTTPVPRPLTTIVPAYPTPGRSPRPVSAATVSVDLPTGSDSPVSIDSSTSRACASTRRMSAGTRLPDSSSTTSPGTREALATSRRRPPRTTRACGWLRFVSARTACSARRS